MNHSGTFFTLRSAEDVFDFVADPERFARLLPDFESVSIQDASHFTMRISMSVGQVSGRSDLAMELWEAVRPARLEYRGRGIVAGSPLNFAMQFNIAPSEASSVVSWQGEVSVSGMLAFLAGGMIEPISRRNFESMVERLQNRLREEDTSAGNPPPDSSVFL